MYVVTLRPHRAVSVQTDRVQQVIGSLLTLVGLIAAGVVIGVVVSHHNSSSSSSSSSSKSSSGATASGPSGVVNQTNPNDPSTFVKDPNLKHSFWGLAYTPAGSQLPECGNSLGQSQLHFRVGILAHVLILRLQTTLLKTFRYVRFHH